MYHYGYYVKLADGRFKLSGDDWGQTPDSYTIGKSLGVRGEVEGIVLGIVKGEEAKRNGFDVMVLVEQKSIATGQPVTPHVPRLTTRATNSGRLSRAQIPCGRQQGPCQTSK